MAEKHPEGLTEVSEPSKLTEFERFKELTRKLVSIPKKAPGERSENGKPD